MIQHSKFTHFAFVASVYMYEDYDPYVTKPGELTVTKHHRNQNSNCIKTNHNSNNEDALIAGMASRDASTSKDLFVYCVTIFNQIIDWKAYFV